MKSTTRKSRTFCLKCFSKLVITSSGKKKCPPCYKKVSQKRREKNRGLIRQQAKDRIKRVGKTHRWYAYGITEKEYQSMLEVQKYKCPVCDCNLQFAVANVDHCHTSGKVRSILCNTCNTALGGFKDSVILLRSAINYLYKHHGEVNG